MKRRYQIVGVGLTTVLGIMAGVVTVFDFAQISPVAKAMKELETVSLTLGTEALVFIGVFFTVTNVASALAGAELMKKKLTAAFSRLHMFVHHMRDSIGQHSIRIFLPGFSHEALCNQFERCMVTSIEDIRSAMSVFIPDCSCAISLTDGKSSISYHLGIKILDTGAVTT